MQRVSFKQRTRYKFDSIMAMGTPALIAMLAIATLALVGVVSIFLFILGAGPDPTQVSSLPQLIQTGFNHAFNTGNIWSEDSTAPYFVSMIVVSLGGMFILSALIGILTTGMDNRITELRKGRSVVLENNHIVLLGWSPQIFPILQQLSFANQNATQNRKRTCVVVMAEKDKVEMEDAIHDKLARPHSLKVVCRTGSPIDLVDLGIVNLQGSRSIIVLAPECEDPDSEVLKTVLAITKGPLRRNQPYHVVAQIRDPKNMEAARLVGGHETQFIDVGDAVARLIAQTCRQAGLSAIYNDLLDFEGDEIYIKHEPSMSGKAFRDVLDSYEKCTVIGLLRGERVSLNPHMDTLISEHDKLIVIAEDDTKIVMSPPDKLHSDTGPLHDTTPFHPKSERTLILGWNWRAHKIVSEMDGYVAPGSELTVMSNSPLAQQEITHHCEHLTNQKVTVVEGDITSRRRLEALGVPGYDHIIVLSYCDDLDPQRADARTLITLLHLREMRERSGKDFSIVSEMQDIRNKELAEVVRADDLIVSDKLISLMTAQISENRHLKEVLGDLFNPGGCEIYMRPASEYVSPGSSIDFYALVEAAKRAGQIALGYRLMAEGNDPSKIYGVVLNPHKKATFTLNANDKVIVLAES